MENQQENKKQKDNNYNEDQIVVLDAESTAETDDLGRLNEESDLPADEDLENDK